MSNLYVMEAANLFCGDHDPSKSLHLQLQDLRLPTLEEIYADHAPGGGIVDVEVAVGVSRLEAGFKLAGWNEDTISGFGIATQQRNIFTAYGAIRNKRTGALLEGRAVFQARIGRIEPDAFRRGELMGHDHSLREIYHYELHMGGKELFRWDFFENSRYQNGVNLNADINSILRIPQA
ncbi:phage major tail tube protein [Microvirga sp. Mcv34]|uniref:phage major tail tube protein n=1 Tax=Microvirga sp. Mcv34 TaxID=2926016 RepID=UPI0021C5B24B|nr:phage major tail tube protein [Microvirga sp. Mcv34]